MPSCVRCLPCNAGLGLQHAVPPHGSTHNAASVFDMQCCVDVEHAMLHQYRSLVELSHCMSISKMMDMTVSEHCKMACLARHTVCSQTMHGFVAVVHAWYSFRGTHRIATKHVSVKCFWCSDFSLSISSIQYIISIFNKLYAGRVHNACMLSRLMCGCASVGSAREGSCNEGSSGASSC